jgi:hypothetical protein
MRPFNFTGAGVVLEHFLTFRQAQTQDGARPAGSHPLSKKGAIPVPGRAKAQPESQQPLEEVRKIAQSGFRPPSPYSDLVRRIDPILQRRFFIVEDRQQPDRMLFHRSRALRYPIIRTRSMLSDNQNMEAREVGSKNTNRGA